MNEKTKSILFKKFDKEDKLMFPLHKSDFEHPVREKFIRDLCNSEDFVPVKNTMEDKYSESLKSMISKFGKKDRIFVMLFAAMIVGIPSYMFSDKLFNHTKVESANKRLALNTLDLISITMLVILGIFSGKLILGSTKQAKQELSVERFYQRMSVRLFYKFKKMYPELKEDTLEHCNPELSRVIKTLLIANMSEQDILDIQHTAANLSEYKYTKLHKGEAEELQYRDKSLRKALGIISRHLENNPDLAKVVYEVYTGQVPKTFVLNPNNQKIK